MQSTQFPEFGFFRLKQVLEVFPVSKSHWYEGQKAGKYPMPVKLSTGISAYRIQDIRQLVEEFGK